MNQNTFCKYCHRIPSQCGCTHPVNDNFEEGYRAGYKFCANMYEANTVKELTEEMAKNLANLYVEQYGHPFPAVSYAMAIQKYLKGELDLSEILRKAQE